MGWVFIGGITVYELLKCRVRQILRIGVPRDRLGKESSQRTGSRVLRLFLGSLFKARGVLPQLLPNGLSGGQFVEQDHTAPSVLRHTVPRTHSSYLRE